jgi:predicted HicB family RNase H-like nuclease
MTTAEPEEPVKLQNLPISEELHRKLKARAAEQGMKLREYVAAELEPALRAVVEVPLETSAK